MHRHMDQFLATAAHDLRTPVSVALMSVDLAQLRVERVAKAVAPAPDCDRSAGWCDNVSSAINALEHASQAIERLSRFTSRLFDVALARTGELELRPLACDLATLVRDYTGAQRALTPDRTIRLDLPTDMAVPVVADADRLGQVVTNFLTNALKYSPPNRPIDVNLAVDGRQVRLAVRDRGPGLPLEERDRVWEPFHRAQGIAAQGSTRESLGLGLYICKTVVERHGGQVGVESVVGKGSTFWFTLPLAGAIG